GAAKPEGTLLAAVPPPPAPEPAPQSVTFSPTALVMTMPGQIGVLRSQDGSRKTDLGVICVQPYNGRKVRLMYELFIRVRSKVPSNQTLVIQSRLDGSLHPFAVL